MGGIRKLLSELDSAFVGIAVEEPAAERACVVDLAHAAAVGVAVEEDAGSAAPVQQPASLVTWNLAAFVDDARTLCNLGLASGVQSGRLDEKRLAADAAPASAAHLMLKQAQLAFLRVVHGSGQRVASKCRLVLGQDAFLVVQFSS
jgi:hypothetical protein